MKWSIFLVGSFLIGPALTLAKEKIDWNKVTFIDPLPERYKNVLNKYGETIKNNSGRIVGGEVAAKGKYPYQAALIINSMSFCGGALISNLYVLTAAHCAANAYYITVMLGAHDVTAEQEPGRLEIQVEYENIIVHPNWNPQQISDDIAIIQLLRRITFTETIQPVSLPTRTEAKLDMELRDVLASGWGRDSNTASSISPLLRFTKLTVQVHVICKHFFGDLIRTTNICTDTRLGQGTCNGDSGGPLVHDRENGESCVVGVVSFGSSIGCVVGWPSVFTRIGEYLNWIRDNTDIIIKD